MWLRNAVLGVFVVALLGGIMLPVYSDEIGWRLQERAAFDGVDKLFTEICGPNTLARPPFWMMPARYFSALFNSLFAAPIYVRLSGIIYALVWTGLMLLLIRRIADNAGDRTALSTMAVGFMSLGTMPLLLILSRPEQPIVLAFTGALLIALIDWKQTGADTPVGTAWWRSLAVVLLALVAMSYHVKAVATVPLFLFCLLLASRGRGAVVPRLGSAALLVAAGVWAAEYWIHRMDCQGDPIVHAAFVRSTGAAMISATDLSQIVQLLGKALGNVSVLLYPGTPAPRANPMAFWLPAGQISTSESFTWFLVLVAIWSLVLIAAAWCLLHAMARAYRQRIIDVRAVLSAALVATVLGWSATGFTGIYEAPFTLPMLVFSVVLALSTYEGRPSFADGVRWGAAGIGLLGVVSVALVAMLYGPPLAAAAQRPGYVHGQPLSITPFGYANLRRDILAVARKCGITNPHTSRALMIDDLTYFPFMKSRLPEHRAGLFWPAVTAQDPIAYLRTIKSDGIVASCHALPPDLQARAKHQGQFCCLGPPNW